ncbi:MAG: hypothetical protein ABIG95_06615 [Candidatus Woesearchaeota archaeon]
MQNPPALETIVEGEIQGESRLARLLIDKTISYWTDIEPELGLFQGCFADCNAVMGYLAAGAAIGATLGFIGGLYLGSRIGATFNLHGIAYYIEKTITTLASTAAGGAVGLRLFPELMVRQYKFKKGLRANKLASLQTATLPLNIGSNPYDQLLGLYQFAKAVAKIKYVSSHIQDIHPVDLAVHTITRVHRIMTGEWSIADEARLQKLVHHPGEARLDEIQAGLIQYKSGAESVTESNLQQKYKTELLRRVQQEVHTLRSSLAM